MKGSEDLGSGLKAGFAFTSFLRMNTGALGRFTGDTNFSRDANLWVSGDWGKITLGRWLAPNFLPTVIFNPFGDSFAFSPLVLHANVPLFNGTKWGATTPSDTGWSSQIAYSTPNVGGLSANIHYQMRGDSSTGTGRNVGANLLYFSGPLGLTAFYENAQAGNPILTTFADNSSRTNWMLGGSYDLKAVKLFGTYGQAKNSVTTAKATTASLGASVPMGAGKFLAGYARTKSTALNATRQTITIGYDYSLSKRTDLYANVMNDRITGTTSGTSVGLGIRHAF